VPRFSGFGSAMLSPQTLALVKLIRNKSFDESMVGSKKLITQLQQLVISPIVNAPKSVISREGDLANGKRY
jgi:hypothetical protein